MSQDIRDFVTTSCDLVGLGEPTHREPAFGRVRNELFAQLVERGFRSIALETDRVAALTVNDFVQDGTGTLDSAMRDGFSHGFGDLDPNRELVAWMRAYNQHRPPQARVTFHGFDAPLETMSAPSPRRYLEYARDYLRLDLDIANLAGDDERWSRTEAIMDPALSIGDTAEADRLRSIADDMLTALLGRAPELIATTSRTQWSRARTHLTAGRDLLRYHRQAARRLEASARISLLSGARDALMAENLLEIRSAEDRRGPTLAFAHNGHLRPNLSTISIPGMDLEWFGSGAIVSSLLGERYSFIAGSLGSSEALGLHEPEPDTHEGFLQSRIATWALTSVRPAASARTRTDTTPRQGYFPLDRATLDAAAAILHLNSGAAATTPTHSAQR